MRVVEQVELKLEWLDANQLTEHPYPKHIRSIGIHQSDLIRSKAIQLGKLTDEEKGDEFPLRMFLGMAWEQMCVRLYPEILWQPGEYTRGEIAGSPDGLSAELNVVKVGTITGPVVEEFKYTGKSLRTKGGDETQLKDITREWMWMAQIMGYCLMVGGEYGRLHVCWSRGTYGYPMTERYLRYLIKFEQRELEDNWKLLTGGN